MDKDKLTTTPPTFGKHVEPAAARGAHEEVNPGKCRLYRYVSGAVWNRYT